MNESDVDQIAVNLLTPLIARLIGWASGVLLGGAGISLTVPGDAAGKIALVIVGLIGFVVHQLMAKATTVSNAKSAYAQGSAAAGSPIAISATPNVVAGNAIVATALTSVTVPTTTNSVPMPTAPQKLAPIADSAGNITIAPKVTEAFILNPKDGTKTTKPIS
jgi:predicted lipid-binding transport protein (Tim44 family)